MTDLCEDIRATIDAAAPPVTFEEVRARSRRPATEHTTAFTIDLTGGQATPSTSPPLSRGHRPVRILVATVAVLAVLAGTGSLIALGPRSRAVTAGGGRHHARSSDHAASA